MLTVRIPTVPSKGAITRMRSSRAQDSASCASTTDTLAVLSSTTRWAIKLCATNSWLRLRLARAICTCASDWRTSARCNTSSSCTTTSPLRMRPPSVKPSVIMRPDTSGRIMTFWRLRNVPIDCASSCSLVTSTLATSTPAGPPGPPAGRAADAPAAGAPSVPEACEPVISVGPLGLFWYQYAAPDAAAMPATAITE